MGQNRFAFGMRVGVDFMTRENIRDKGNGIALCEKIGLCFVLPNTPREGRGLNVAPAETAKPPIAPGRAPTGLFLVE